MALTQCTMRSIIHHQKRSLTLDTKLENPHNVGMTQVSNRTGLGTEFLYIVTCQLSMQHLDSGLSTKVNMLTQVDLGKTTFTQKAGKLVVTKLLTHTINHSR